MNQHLHPTPAPHQRRHLTDRQYVEMAPPHIQQQALADVCRNLTDYAELMLRRLKHAFNTLDCRDHPHALPGMIDQHKRDLSRQMGEVASTTALALLGLHNYDLAAARKYAGSQWLIPDALAAVARDHAAEGVAMVQAARHGTWPDEPPCGRFDW